jgi:hypothetical protein
VTPEVAVRRAPLLAALVVALIVAGDGGAPVEPTRPVQPPPPYPMGDGPRGISLELVPMAPTTRIVRPTRLR